MAESKKELAEKYDNWTLIDLNLSSDSPEIPDITNAIYDDLQTLPGFKTGSSTIRKRNINIVILNLYKQVLVDPTAYVGYHRSSNWYSSLEPRYYRIKISRMLVEIVDAMVRKGYIENIKGHFDRTGRRPSHISRMRATERLCKLFLSHKAGEAVIEKDPSTECIILRKVDPDTDKKYDASYKDTPETERMRSELREYNDLLRRSFIDMQHYPSEGIPTKKEKLEIHVDFHNKFVRRIFKESWEVGGRFYGGWWQNLPKKWRKKINIGYHQPVIEVDYSGLHIILLYAMEGIDYWEVDGKDPYHLDDYEHSERMRGLLKKVLLTAINAGTIAKAIKAVRHEINRDKGKYAWIHEDLGIDIEKLIEDFSARHRPISHHFYSGRGVALQYIDSCLAEYIIREMIKDKVPVLCVHDSFISVSAMDETLRMRMAKALEAFLSKEGLPLLSAGPKMKAMGVSGKYLNMVIEHRTTGHWGGEDFKKALLGFSTIDRDYEVRHINHMRKFPFTSDSLPF